MNNLTLYLTCQFWALGSSNSTEKKIISKISDEWGYNYLILAEKIVGKEEIARHEQFPFFPQCFQKLSVVDALK